MQSNAGVLCGILWNSHAWVYVGESSVYVGTAMLY